MVRSTLILTSAILVAAASAQRQNPTARDLPQPSATESTAASKVVNVGDVEVHGANDNPGSIFVLPDGSDGLLARIDLTRDLLVAVQGNMDRERTERQNGESR